MKMESLFVPMRDRSVPILGGGHDSDGWLVDSPWHHHDMHQLLYAFAGLVEVEAPEGGHFIPHQFAAWIPAGTVHRTRIQAVPSGSIFLSVDLVPTPGDRLRVIRAPALLREMVAHAKRWPLGSAETAAGRAFFTCVGHLCPAWIADEVDLVLPTSHNARVRAAMEATRQDLHSITFAEAYRAAGLSERSLRRKFRQETGLTWEEYRRRLRILTAIELLDTTAESIGTVAATVGYDNQAAFAKTFNAYVGMSPTQYRRQRKSG